ncbi:MAG: hypothetical protein QOC86_2915 [Gaiellales bacterium]|nr:hypothetical protein [Gaiellales bacterium]
MTPRLVPEGSVSMRARAVGIVLLLVAVAASPAAAGDVATAASPFSVRSTLDGKTELPQRMHWIARPSIGSSRIVEVIFMIDGRIAWVEHKPPYVYGNDGNWLVTSALEPGTHRFTVKTTTIDLRTVSRTVRASVVPAPAPPAELAGSWQRTVTKEQAGYATPGGVWGITIDPSGWIIWDPGGSRDCRCGDWIDVAYLSGNLLELRSGIWTKTETDPTATRFGNGWCNATNAPVDYTWTAAANTLTRTLSGPDLCGDPGGKQDGVLAGVWTRVA